MSNACTEELFLKDVTDHKITVIRDDGVHRHVQFRKPGTYCMGFDLITWPGYLCYAGDMGCNLFARMEDMFEFFRVAPNKSSALHINLSYWSEKLQASDCNGRWAKGVKRFSEEAFKAAIKDRFDEIVSDADEWPAPRKAELWEAIEADIFGQLYDDGHEAQIAVRDFSFDDQHDLFTGFFERDVTDYTYHFVWCCYAIAWGVRQYDALKVPMDMERPITVQNK